MTCPCGAPLDPDEEFCLRCGHVVGFREERPRSARWLWLLLAAALVVMLVMGFYSTFFSWLFR
ncbi:DUF2116 family Zn-ribbon domain-containing protein [Candidatus Woesearchaeota archaeon]|nr:DUF2116 family Zn-ribbon domain-containing protein [Candidatus Woesearchaeota archaeon]